MRRCNIEQYDAVSRSFSDTNPSFERSGVAGDAEIVDGIFQGSCRHRDGNLFGEFELCINTLQPHYNAVVYNMNSVRTWLKLGSH